MNISFLRGGFLFIIKLQIGGRRSVHAPASGVKPERKVPPQKEPADPMWKRYLFPESLQEAVQALGEAHGRALPVAGGTDLLLEIQQGHHPPVDTLLDVTRIPELNRLERQGNALFIGAAVPVGRIAASEPVNRFATALAEACGQIGGPQVRNVATLGGNVAHALPAADGMIALVALGAEAWVASPDGMRQVPLLSLFRGPGVSALDLTREILVGFSLPVVEQGAGSAFARVMRPQGVALPILNMAVWLRREGNVVAEVRLTAGPSGPTPRRAEKIEEFLQGKTPLEEGVLSACKALLPQCFAFRTSPARATAEYRYHLSEVLLEKVLLTAWKRAEECV